jgi:protein-disulfide isomerase
MVSKESGTVGQEKRRSARPSGAASSRGKGSKLPFYALLALIAAGGAGWIAYQATRPKSLGVVTLDPSIPLPESAGYLLGDSSAPVKVLEFADFECPACGHFANLTEPDVRRRLIETGVVSLRFLDFPLSAHQNSWDASMAAACAAEQGKFWEMHDLIFQAQDQWATQATNRPRGVLERLARSLGLDMARWNQCYDEQRYRLRIAAHQREGERRRVTFTPTFIIGSRMIPGALSYDVFKAYVDSALADLEAERAQKSTKDSR